ncbi:asparagine synthetase B family protein [Wenzhouxiangella sp. EGI_FJ10409]|uniref:hypothetical protein n=1 Tax=Wenzhouxiangella sp. EGI_FJ10409 TaxID=3243767 RepID=UPI0035E1CC11
MAGFLGLLGGDPDAARLTGALDLLHHHASFRGEIISTQAPVALAANFHAGDPPDIAVDRDRQLAVGIYGAPVDPDAGRVVGAADVLDGYGKAGNNYLESLDSGFVIALADRQRNRFVLVNDRMATVPVHFGSHGESFAFAPEGKAVLALLGRAPEMDGTGALEFLGMGHAVGTRTLFDGVHLMAPATRLEIELSSGQVDIDRYWQLDFSAARPMKVKEAAGALRDVLRKSAREAMTPPPENYGLLLTGGYDSRTALAILADQGCPPAKALTWGIRDDIPLSDVSVAREIAAQWQVPFKYLRYDSDTLVANAADWARVSELGSDNMGGFAAGPGFMYEKGALESPVIANGDQLFGIGGIPVSREHAIEVATGLHPSGLGPGLATVIPAARHDEADRLIRDGIVKLVDERRGDSPKDILDGLGHRLHLARWLNNPAYFREPMVSVRRPLLQRPGMELFQQLPEGLRVDKRLLVEMQRRFMPELLDTPIATANCLVDWDAAWIGDEAARAFARTCLDLDRLGQSALGPWLDPGALNAAVTAYFGSRHRPMSREPERATAITRLRRAAAGSRFGSLAVSHAQRLANRVRGKSQGASPGKVVKRMMLIELFLQLIEDGDFGPASGKRRHFPRNAAGWLW